MDITIKEKTDLRIQIEPAASSNARFIAYAKKHKELSKEEHK